MIEDGENVIIPDDLRAKLYMTANDYDLSGDEITAKQDTKGSGLTMTPEQRLRYQKRLRAKPRPRDIFDVEALVQKKNKAAAASKQKAKPRKASVGQQKQSLVLTYCQNSTHNQVRNKDVPQVQDNIPASDRTNF